jgi:hypothetical protein
MDLFVLGLACAGRSGRRPRDAVETGKAVRLSLGVVVALRSWIREPAP